MNEVFCADYTSEMVFSVIHKGGRNMREFLTPRQLGADWPRAHPAERESSQLPARVTNTFSGPHFLQSFSEVASKIQILSGATPMLQKS